VTNGWQFVPKTPPRILFAVGAMRSAACALPQMIEHMLPTLDLGHVGAAP